MCDVPSNLVHWFRLVGSQRHCSCAAGCAVSYAVALGIWWAQNAHRRQRQRTDALWHMEGSTPALWALLACAVTVRLTPGPA